MPNLKRIGSAINTNRKLSALALASTVAMPVIAVTSNGNIFTKGGPLFKNYELLGFIAFAAVSLASLAYIFINSGKVGERVKLILEGASSDTDGKNGNHYQDSKSLLSKQILAKASGSKKNQNGAGSSEDQQSHWDGPQGGDGSPHLSSELLGEKEYNQDGNPPTSSQSDKQGAGEEYGSECKYVSPSDALFKSQNVSGKRRYNTKGKEGLILAVEKGDGRYSEEYSSDPVDEQDETTEQSDNDNSQGLPSSVLG